MAQFNDETREHGNWLGLEEKKCFENLERTQEIIETIDCYYLNIGANCNDDYEILKLLNHCLVQEY